MEYTYKGQEYILNLIDTQVTSIFVRSFSIYCACEGALLIVDAAQSIQAQTISIYMARKRLGNYSGFE
jgi:GTP-binding protein LepA